MAQRITYSIVIELENATVVDDQTTLESLRRVAAEIRGLETSDNGSQCSADQLPKVVFVHAGRADGNGMLRAKLRDAVPELFEVSRVECVAFPGGRYYQLKNAGIERADGDVVVLHDSDAVPEPGWLNTHLQAFENPRTIATAGHTYLQFKKDLISRTLALTWIFPLRDGDERQQNRRGLFVNNAAFRRSWILQQNNGRLFEDDPGFKVACTLLHHQMQQQGLSVVKVNARSAHAPLMGLHFFYWRAWHLGRDADRKLVVIKKANRMTRVAKAVERVLKSELRAIRRIFWRHRQVGLRWWEIPSALALVVSFYLWSGVGQLFQVFDQSEPAPTIIPSRVQYEGAFPCPKFRS